MEQFGTLIAHVMRLDVDGNRCPVVVRLGWTLYWTDQVDEGLSEELRTWTKLPRSRRHEIPLRRDGSVELGEAPDCRNIVRLTYREAGKAPSVLQLDFGEKAQLASNWYDAVRFMVTPWSKLLSETHLLLRFARATGLSEQLSDEDFSTARKEEKVRKACEWLRTPSEYSEESVRHLEKIISGFDLSESFMKDVLGRLPLVAAGFQLLALGLSSTARVIALKVDERREGRVRKEMAYIVGLVITEMLHAVRRGPAGHAHLKALSRIMDGLESTVRMLDEYVLSHFVQKFFSFDRDLLQKMLETLDELRKELLGLQAAKGVAELLTRQDRVENLITSFRDSTEEWQNELLHAVAEMKEAFEEDSGGPDMWTPGFSTVPPLDFAIARDGVPSVQKLLTAVLESASGQAVAAIGVKGMGGVGKTTACKIVANNPRVRSKFKDGVFWMEFGMDKTAEAALGELGYIVKSSGGSRVSKEIKSMGSKNIEKAFVRARSWFQEHKVLIVADNLWPGKVDWVSKLISLVETWGCVLFSTRFGEIGIHSVVQRIQFDALGDHDLAVLLFNKHLRISEDDQRYKVDVRDRILKVCSGLPLALATAASLVRLLKYKWELMDDGLKEESIMKDIIKARRVDDPGGHPGLESAIELTLEKLDRKELGERVLGLTDSDSCRISWSERYYSLGVMPKSSTSMPIRILGLLWGLKEKELRVAIHVLCDLSLMFLAEEQDIISIHDLQWVYCRHKYSLFDDSKETFWHERIIRGLPCLSGPSLRSGSCEVQGKEIVDIFFSDLPDIACNDYLMDNAVWHLTNGGRRLSSALHLLLTDYRWIRRKAEERGILSVAEDYTCVRRRRNAEECALDQGNSERASVGMSWSLTSEEMEGYAAIEDALRHIPHEASPGWGCEACPVHKDGRYKESRPDSGLAGQLFGRLAFKHGTAISCTATEAIPKSSVEVSGRRRTEARVPASEGSERTSNSWGFWNVISMCFGSTCCLNEPRVHDESKLFSKHIVKQRKGQFRGAVRPRNSIVCKLLSSVEKEATGLWLRPLTDYFGCISRKSDRVIPGKIVDVRSMAASADHKYAYSGSYDGFVRVHEVRTGRLVTKLIGHTESVMSVAVATAWDSGGGELIVSGSLDKTVRCWAMPSGKCIQVLTGHSGAVTCVAVSMDGNRIASGSYWFVYVWGRGKEGLWMRQAQLGHSGEVICVVLSGNGREVASSSSKYGCDDPCLVQLWQETESASVSNEIPVFDRIEICPEGCTGPITFSSSSEDADLLYATNDEIRVWKRDIRKVFPLISLGDRYPACIASSSGKNGTIVAVGFPTRIEVWQLEGAKLLSEFTGMWVVTSVVISGDGQRIISGSTDGTIQVWTIGESDGQQTRRKKTRSETITQVAASEDGSTVVTVHEWKKIRIWSAWPGPEDWESEADREKIRTWSVEGEGNLIDDVVVSENGRIVLISTKAVSQWTVLLWDLVSGEMQRIHTQLDTSPFPGSIAVSRNGCYFAVKGRSPGSNGLNYGSEVWSKGAHKLTVVQAYSGVETAGDALTRYVKEQGLKGSANPSRNYSIPRVSLSSSTFMVQVTFNKFSTAGDTEGTHNPCSCAARAIFECDLDKAVMLPYVRGLEPTTTGVRRPSVGMLGVSRCTDYGSEVEILQVVK